MSLTRTEHERPSWAPDCDYAMSKRNITTRQLAAELGICYTTVSGIINGSRISPAYAKRICNHLGVAYIEGNSSQEAS